MIVLLFRVSYTYGRFNDFRRKDFCSYASAQLYFLQKLQEGRPSLRLSVLSSESLDCDESDSSSEGLDK